jgi:hypothetical protein
MDRRRLRQEVADVFASLNPPEQLTLESLKVIVEEHRSRQIVIRSVPHLGADQVSGLWLTLPNTELVLHAETTSELHREQIILHELAHMVLRHDLLQGEDGHVASLLPDLDRETVARVLARCDRRAEPEVAAELLADLFAAAIARGRRAQRREPLKFRGVFG